jgi:hypothetical protein
MSICLREATSAPVTANTATVTQSRTVEAKLANSNGDMVAPRDQASADDAPIVCRSLGSRRGPGALMAGRAMELN